MNEEALNNEIHRFLKKVGIVSNQELEKALKQAIANGKLNGDETLPITMRLELPAINLHFAVDGDIALAQ